MLQVAKLMDYHVVDALAWRTDEIRIQCQGSLTREASPSGSHHDAHIRPRYLSHFRARKIGVAVGKTESIMKGNG
jgi:hypothetical protein